MINREVNAKKERGVNLSQKFYLMSSFIALTTSIGSFEEALQSRNSAFTLGDKFCWYISFILAASPPSPHAIYLTPFFEYSIRQSFISA